MISVIIPFVTDRGFLTHCLKSVQDQTYTDYEIIKAQGPGTLGQNFNRGLKKAKGEFIKILPDDDWLPTESLRFLSDGIGDAPWVVANAWQMTDEPYIYKPPYLDLENNRLKNGIHGGTTMYRKDVLEAVGGMDESLETGEEYDLHLKLLSLGYDPVYIDKEVFCYRMWTGSKSRQLRRKRKEWRTNEIAKIQARYTD